MVRGMETASRTADSNPEAFFGSRIKAEPEWLFNILRTEQPKLISRISAPEFCTIRAASAMISGSEPKIWRDNGFSPGALASMSCVFGGAINQAVGADHLGTYQAASGFFGQQPQRKIGDSRKGSEYRGVFDFYGTNTQHAGFHYPKQSHVKVGMNYSSCKLKRLANRRWIFAFRDWP